MSGPWEPADEPPLIGLVTDCTDDSGQSGPGSTHELVAVARAAAGQCDGTVVSGVPGEVLQAEPTVCLTLGEACLCATARCEPAVPLLPVDADDGVYSVDVGQVETALETVLAGQAMPCAHWLLSVAVDDEHLGTLLRDLSLITAEPAQITELAVRHVPPASGPADPGSSSHDDRKTPRAGDPMLDAGADGDPDWLDRDLVQVRADGLVVATPAGSYGYAAAADGPLLRPGAGLAVVPVAPFVTDRHNRVTTLAPLSLSVRRDEAPVALRIDGTERTRVDRTNTVRVTPATTISTLVTPESAIR